MSGLKLNNVTKSFGEVHVIHGVDLEIADGEFVVFVGPSGCGKSTLMRLIAGLETVSDGSIAIGGKDVTHVDPAKRGVAMVFQSYALFPHMTVAENIGFGMRVNKVPKDVARQKLAKAAQTLQLENLLGRKPSQLSGGQRQRVAIGRAIVREPGVFLFDEPLSNLDAELRVQMRVELAALHANLKSTMIYVTHDQVEAMTLADKIVVLRAGRIEQIGSPLELYDDPDNLFVAGFLGSPKMNFFPATIGDGSVAKLDHYPTSIDLAVGQPPARGHKVIVGYRPEHFAAKGKAALSLGIDAVEHLGSTTFAYARQAGGEPIAIELREGRAAKTGEALTTYFDPKHVRLFDGTTGNRIR